MSKAIYNSTLEYAPNVVEFWLNDEDDMPINFSEIVTFSIQRIDDDSATYSVQGVVVDNHVKFNISPPKDTLSRPGDDLFSYDIPNYEHIYSVRSSDTTYIIGKLNMVQAC